MKAVEANDADRAIPMTGSLPARPPPSCPPAQRRRPHGRAGRARRSTASPSTAASCLVDLLERPGAPTTRPSRSRWRSAATSTPPRRLELFERRRAEPGHASWPPPEPAAAAAASGSTATCGALREHDTQTIEHDIAWLDRLIAAEREHLRAEGPVTSQEDTTE